MEILDICIYHICLTRTTRIPILTYVKRRLIFHIRCRNQFSLIFCEYEVIYICCLGSCAVYINCIPIGIYYMQSFHGFSTAIRRSTLLLNFNSIKLNHLRGIFVISTTLRLIIWRSYIAHGPPIMLKIPNWLNP